MKNLGERLAIFVAWLLPIAIAKWAFVRVSTYGTVGKYRDTELPSLTAADALDRWLKQDNGL